MIIRKDYKRRYFLIALTRKVKNNKCYVTMINQSYYVQIFKPKTCLHEVD